MSSETPAWLQRWQQAEDDELLYVDQTILLTGGLTREEYDRVAERHEQDAEPEEDTP